MGELNPIFFGLAFSSLQFSSVSLNLKERELSLNQLQEQASKCLVCM